MSIRYLFLSGAIALGLLFATSIRADEPETPADPPAKKKAAGREKKERTEELLAHNEVLAKFEGVEFHVCNGLTGACPERCGASGEMAEFKIVKYLKYEKRGEFGDEKQTTYSIHISDYFKKPMGDPKIRAFISGLKKGDEVLIAWDHIYVSDRGGSWPERPLLKLERASNDAKSNAVSNEAKNNEAEPTKNTEQEAEKKTETEPEKTTVEESPAPEGKQPDKSALSPKLQEVFQEALKLRNDKENNFKGVVICNAEIVDTKVVKNQATAKDRKGTKFGPAWEELALTLKPGKTLYTTQSNLSVPAEITYNVPIKKQDQFAKGDHVVVSVYFYWRGGLPPQVADIYKPTAEEGSK